MDFFRLPPTLRRSIYGQIRLPSQSCYSTTTTTSDGPISTLSSHTTTYPPASHEVKFSASFFHATAPIFLYSTSRFRELPPSPFPEIAFLGRSNVGKSSLLNALFGRPKTREAHVSKRPGRTRTMNGYGVAGGLPMGQAPEKEEKEGRWKRFPRGGIVVVDMPGYGSGSREEWGEEIMKVLSKRKQLRRTFVLVDAEHGLKKTDAELLIHLRRSGIDHSIVLSKVDKVLYAGSRAPGEQRLANKTVRIGEMCASIRKRLDDEAGDGRRGAVDILCCSAEKGLESTGGNGRKIGIDEVRWAALSACGVECDETGRRKGMADFHVLPDDAIQAAVDSDSVYSPLATA